MGVVITYYLAASSKYPNLIVFSVFRKSSNDKHLYAYIIVSAKYKYNRNNNKKYENVLEKMYKNWIIVVGFEQIDRI